MKLVIFNSNRKPEELSGPQSTSGMKHLNISEPLFECVETSFVCNAFRPSKPNPQEQKWNVIGHVKLVHFCVCTAYFSFCHCRDNDKWLPTAPADKRIKSFLCTHFFTLMLEVCAGIHTYNVLYHNWWELFFKLRHISIPELEFPKGKTHSHGKHCAFKCCLSSMETHRCDWNEYEQKINILSPARMPATFISAWVCELC